MQLNELLHFREIMIQCHDNPDADTISSGYGLYLYFKSQGCKVRLVYSGKDEIKKSNVKLMLDKLQIPLEYIATLESESELLITVDSQFGEGNITALPAKKIAVIDHHQDCNNYRDYADIRDAYGSCATLVYTLLLKEGYPVSEDEKLMTALYYGLYMDTNGFSEIKHPYDMDMMEELTPDSNLMNQLKNCNFTFDELEIAANALIRYNYNEALRFAIVRANICDPNLLGFISDLVLQVEGVDTSIAYFEQEYGFKLSVRNCNPEATANEIVKYLVQEMGTGGGHKEKAGGYIIRSRYEENYIGMSLLQYLLNAMKEYFTSYDIIDATCNGIDLSEMELYERLPVIFGMSRTMDLGKEGERISIRTMSRELEIEVSPETYLLINMQGEVFQIGRQQFERNYEMLDRNYNCESEYKPHVKRKEENQSFRLTDYINCCISMNKPQFYVKKLNKTTKIYKNYEDKDYILGEIGDYVAVKNDEEKEVNIIKREHFLNFYQRKS